MQAWTESGVSPIELVAWLVATVLLVSDIVILGAITGILSTLKQVVGTVTALVFSNEPVTMID